MQCDLRKEAHRPHHGHQEKPDEKRGDEFVKGPRGEAVVVFSGAISVEKAESEGHGDQHADACQFDDRGGLARLFGKGEAGSDDLWGLVNGEAGPDAVGLV